MAGEKVIVVDTNEKVSIQLADALNKVGFDASTIQWAEEAQALVQMGGVDAVVLRTKLGGMTGFAFTQALRKNPNLAIRPIVILYGKDDQESKVQAFKSGADDYLVLPFPLPELIYRLDVRLRKTIQDSGSGGSGDLIEDSSTGEMAIPASFPDQGSVVSRSLPMILGIVSARNMTGSLRLTQKGVIRTLFFDEGRLRGVRSSKRGESFSVFALWRGGLGGTEKQKYRALAKSAQDRVAADWLIKNGGLRPDCVNGLAVRHLIRSLEKAVRMMHADFDWTAKDDPAGVLLIESPGLSLIHTLAGIYRSMWFAPKYSVFLPKPTVCVYPTTRLGKIADTLRLTSREESFLGLLARGRTIGEMLDEGHRIIPYAEQLVHLCLSFDVFKTGDKRLLSRKEQDAVAIAVERKASDIRDISSIESESLADPRDEDLPPPPRKTALPPPPPPPPRTDPKPDNKVSMRPEPRPEIRPEPKPEPRVEPHAPGEDTHPGVIVAQSSSVPPAPPSAPLARLPLINVQGPSSFEFSTGDLASGNLSEKHVALPYARIFEDKLTGILNIRIAEYESKLFFKRGHLLFARTDDPKMRVDQIMVDLGMITAAQRERVQEAIEELGKMRSGTIIFKRQIVNMVQLSEALHHQIGLILKTVFTASDGTFAFTEGALPEEEHIPMDLQTAVILLDNLRAIDDPSVLIDILPDLSVTLGQSSRSRELMQQIRLGPNVTQIFDKFRHGVTGREAFVGSDISLREFKSVLCGLILLGLLYRIK